MRSFFEPVYMLVQHPTWESFKALLLYNESQKLGSTGTEEKIVIRKPQLLCYSKVKNQQKNKNVGKISNSSKKGKINFSVRWQFSAETVVPPLFLRSSSLFIPMTLTIPKENRGIFLWRFLISTATASLYCFFDK